MHKFTTLDLTAFCTLMVVGQKVRDNSELHTEFSVCVRPLCLTLLLKTVAF